VASSGDNGAAPGTEFPASSPNVLAVGGTSLNAPGGTYASETGWSGSGGGVSQYESKPAYQNGFQSSNKRTVPDVAYNADPNTGVEIYDTANGGWYQVGGTSAGAPQWAALIAIANEGRALAGKATLDGPTQTLYALYKMAQKSYATYFHDITSGSNGYNAHAGYDLVTGLGSPKAQAVIQELLTAAGSGTGIQVNALPSTANLTQTATHDLQVVKGTPAEDSPGVVSTSSTAGHTSAILTGLSTRPAAVTGLAPAALTPEAVRVGRADAEVRALAVVRAASRQESGTAKARVATVSDRADVERQALRVESGAEDAVAAAALDNSGVSVEAAAPAALSSEACDLCFGDDALTMDAGDLDGKSAASGEEAGPVSQPLIAAAGLAAVLGILWGAPQVRQEVEKRRGVVRA
jgi:hypothetical protein